MQLFPIYNVQAMHTVVLKQTLMATPSSLSLTNNPNKKEEEMEKEKSTEEIISNLPMNKHRGAQHLYIYQGFWYHHRTLKGTIFAQRNFKAQPTDILLATHPKCGTTWLKALAFAIKNRANSPPGNQDHPLLGSSANVLVRNIEIGLFQSYSMEEIENFPSPRLFGTHVPYVSLPESISDVRCRVVYLCRDPKDMFVSMWHFFNKVKEDPLLSLEEAFELFCQGFSFYGPYWDHVLGYYKASLEFPEIILFWKYEDMQSDTLNMVKRLAEFMGYPFSLEEEAKGVVEEIIQLCSFENMSNLEVTKKGKLPSMLNNDIFFRKGKVGDSKNYLTDEMVKRLDTVTKERFRGFEIGY